MQKVLYSYFTAGSGGVGTTILVRENSPSPAAPPAARCSRRGGLTGAPVPPVRRHRPITLSNSEDVAARCSGDRVTCGSFNVNVA